MIEERVFCIHGGLSPEIQTLDQIRLIDRNKEIPTSSGGGFSDLLWSDPDEEIQFFSPNPRGAGFLFGKKQVDEVSPHSTNRIRFD